MANNDSSNAIKGGALLAAGVTLLSLGVKSNPTDQGKETPPAKPNVVTVNVNTPPAVKPKPVVVKPRPAVQTVRPKPKPRNTKLLRFQGPISVSDRSLKLSPAVMPMQELTVMPRNARPGVPFDNRHWLRPMNGGVTLKPNNTMYELEGLGANGLEGWRWRRRRANRRAGQNIAAFFKRQIAAANAGRAVKATPRGSASSRLSRLSSAIKRAARRAARRQNQMLSGEAKMRRALEILRKNGMF